VRHAALKISGNPAGLKGLLHNRAAGRACGHHATEIGND
jgi:hypothetical protein